MTGDAVLRAVASACRGGLRDFDLFGRFGGEEFAFFLPETPLEAGLQAAERLRTLVAAATIEHGGLSLRVTASFGVAGTAGGGAEMVEELIARADAALYRANQGGRDRVERER